MALFRLLKSHQGVACQGFALHMLNTVFSGITFLLAIHTNKIHQYIALA